MMQGTVTSIQVGLPRAYGSEHADDPHDQPWTTGFLKQPVAGPVWVGQLNIVGDAQADLLHHGGADKAVLAYSADHYPAWREQLDLPQMQAGGFGENLTIAGLTERDVAVGDQWLAGDALLEISQPRQPCWKLGRRWRLAELPKLVVQSGRSGWYLRVVEEGLLSAGDRIELVKRPRPEWTIARAAEVFYAANRRQEKQDLAAVPELSLAWKQHLTSLVEG